MDRPLDLFEELDLTPDALYAKRRAEFDRWFDKKDVRLYEAVMLSMRVVPQEYHRLGNPVPASHAPRYPDEFFFKVDRVGFHDRMVAAIAAIKSRALKGTPDPGSVNESACRVTLDAFERWANKANLSLPTEWRKQNVDPIRAPSWRVREQNNRLRIIRALMRAGKISDEAALADVVMRARLLSPVEPRIVKGVFHAVGWEDKNPSKRSSEERKALRSWPDNSDLIRIIAALISWRKLRISKKGGPKRIDRLIYDDLLARDDPDATVPKIDTIDGVFKEACAALSDWGEPDPS